MSNWSSDAIEFGDIETTHGLMRAYAAALLYNPDDTYAAACRVFPDDPHKASYASRIWRLEQVVKDEMERLLTEHGSAHFLPNKSEVGREIVKIARAAKSDAQALSGWRFYCELMGFMPEKAASGGGATNNIFVGANKVMQVTHHGSNEEYEQACFEQQQKLIASASEDL